MSHSRVIQCRGPQVRGCKQFNFNKHINHVYKNKNININHKILIDCIWILWAYFVYLNNTSQYKALFVGGTFHISRSNWRYSLSDVWAPTNHTYWVGLMHTTYLKIFSSSKSSSRPRSSICYTSKACCPSLNYILYIQRVDNNIRINTNQKVIN